MLHARQDKACDSDMPGREMVKKVLVYGCSNENYRPLPIWKSCLERCKSIGLEYRHEVFEAPDEHRSIPGFQQKSWYWYTANKLAMCANALEKYTSYDIFIFSDCDILFFENAAGWEHLTEWFLSQQIPVAYMRDHGGDVFNSGFYMIKKGVFRQMAHFNRLLHRLASEKELYYGDQTALNFMRPIFKAMHIHSRYTFLGSQSGPLLCFYHGVGGGDHMTPVQHGGIPNLPFYQKKIQHLEEMLAIGNERLGK